MRKISICLLLTFIFTSCDNREEVPTKSQADTNAKQLYIINGDIEYYREITDGSKPGKPIFIYDIPEKTKEDTTKMATSKTSEESVSINFGYGIGNPTNSGCTIKKYNNGNSYYTDAGVYGSNPYTYPYPETTSYLVRGYGLPHLNTYYGSLIMFVSNKGKKIQNRYGIFHENDESGSAISIEYPFKANITYEISLKVTFYDNRYLIDKVYSDGYPTIYVQLKNDGIIEIPYVRSQTQDPCATEGINSLNELAFDYVNYTRSYTPDSRAVIQRTLNFKFSPTEEKKALLISLHPAKSEPGYGAPISTNNYTMVMPLVKITEEPFDPTLNIEVKPLNEDRRSYHR